MAYEDGREVSARDARGEGGSGAAGVGVRLRRVARGAAVPRGGHDIAVERLKVNGVPAARGPRACQASWASWLRLFGATGGGAAQTQARGGGSSSAGRARSSPGATRLCSR